MISSRYLRFSLSFIRSGKSPNYGPNVKAQLNDECSERCTFPNTGNTLPLNTGVNIRQTAFSSKHESLTDTALLPTASELVQKHADLDLMQLLGNQTYLQCPI